MKHIDITVDLETCALSPNAAVMQIAAVAWNREAENFEELFPQQSICFETKIDLRSSWLLGLDFDPNTQKWWTGRDKEAKERLVAGDVFPLEEAMTGFFDWINDNKSVLKCEHVCLWAQGSDFDIAILRNICGKLNLKIPISFRDFRDARSVIAEVGNIVFTSDDNAGLLDHDKIYAHLPDYKVMEPGVAHDALFDAKRTSFAVCYLLKSLKQSITERKAVE